MKECYDAFQVKGIKGVKMKMNKSIKPEHSPLIGGFIGGLTGILFSLILRNESFIILNTLILGTITGCAYGWITAKVFSEVKIIRSSIKKGIAIGGVIGALFGLNPLSFGVFVFGYGLFLVYILLVGIGLEIVGYEEGSDDWKLWIIFMFSGGIFGAVLGAILWGVEGLIAGVILGAIPVANLVFVFILGSFIGAGIMQSEIVQLALFTPLFSILLFAIAGYFAGKKTVAEKIKMKMGEKIEEVPTAEEGGGDMTAGYEVKREEVKKEKAPISAEERGRRYVMAGVCWFAISFFLFLILDLATTPSYGKGGLLLILSIFTILPGTCALLGMGARAFKRSEERTRVRGAKNILYFGIFWFVFWLFVGWIDSLVIGEEMPGLAFLFTITLPGTAVISLISRWSVRGLKNIYGKIYKRSFIAFTSITGVVMVIIFWVPLLNFFYEITPFLTYSNVMRIVVVGVVIYIVVNVLRILRKV